MSDDQKNVLLQCLGTRYAPIPDIRRGIISRNTTMIACSDGFWRTVGTEEIRQHLCPQMCLTDEDMLRECKKLVNKAISRDEDDNISVAAACLEF
jgi:serine/threonine protein phosphatase PrpC